MVLSLDHPIPHDREGRQTAAVARFIHLPEVPVKQQSRHSGRHLSSSGHILSPQLHDQQLGSIRMG
jgi:hypothetical protein